MRKIAADFNRKIDLPGIGPCPRPIDIDQSVTGFADLVSLRIYAFSDGNVVNGESEGDEVLIALLRGTAQISIDGAHQAAFDLDVAGTRVIYMPPGHHYRLVPRGDADIAYMRARTGTVRPPRGFAAEAGAVAVDEHAEHLQLRIMTLAATRCALETARGADAERLAHFLNPAMVNAQTSVQVAGWETLALDRGEALQARAAAGTAELLVVSAR